jgi:hypothetical protein
MASHLPTLAPIPWGPPATLQSMGELLWAGLLLVALGALAATQIFPWYALVENGNTLMLGAAAIGLPIELLYFGLLWLALGRVGRPEGWYWRSFAHHHLLSPGQRWWILPGFYLGAVAFLAMAIGIGTVLLGFVAAWRQA